MQKIDVAVVGLGGMGGPHVGAAKSSPHVNKIYGWEPNWDFTSKRAADMGIIGSRTYEEILNNPDIKLVYINFDISKQLFIQI